MCFDSAFFKAVCPPNNSLSYRWMQIVLHIYLTSDSQSYYLLNFRQTVQSGFCLVNCTSADSMGLPLVSGKFLAFV